MADLERLCDTPNQLPPDADASAKSAALGQAMTAAVQTKEGKDLVASFSQEGAVERLRFALEQASITYCKLLDVWTSPPPPAP